MYLRCLDSSEDVTLRAPALWPLLRQLLLPLLPAPSSQPLLLCRVLLGQWHCLSGSASRCRRVRQCCVTVVSRGVHVRGVHAPIPCARRRRRTAGGFRA